MKNKVMPPKLNSSMLVNYKVIQGIVRLLGNLIVEFHIDNRYNITKYKS